MLAITHQDRVTLGPGAGALLATLGFSLDGVSRPAKLYRDLTDGLNALGVVRPSAGHRVPHDKPDLPQDQRDMARKINRGRAPMSITLQAMAFENIIFAAHDGLLCRSGNL
jgi:hypothetical protein